MVNLSPEMKAIARRMKEFREKEKLSQRQIAAICKTSQATIGKIELGNAKVPVDILVRLANSFDISMDYLCGRTDKTQGELYGSKPRIMTNKSKEEMTQFLEMCFDPASPLNGKLKEAILQLMEESQ